jgi:hypothetical protein
MENPQNLKDLLISMPQRLAEVTERGGATTHYYI